MRVGSPRDVGQRLVKVFGPARFTTLPTPPRFAGGMEMMENRLPWVQVPCGFDGMLRSEAAAYAVEIAGDGGHGARLGRKMLPGASAAEPIRARSMLAMLRAWEEG